MKFEKFKTKDYVLIGIIAALYIVLYMIAGFTTSALSQIVHAFMPAIFALLFGGIIMLFTINKVPKFGVMSIFAILLALIFSLMGMAYIPLILSILVLGILGDLIAASANYKSKVRNSLGYGVWNLGPMLGGAIPAWFFAEEYIQYWTEKGMPQEKIQEGVNQIFGWLGVGILSATFLGGVFGILLGYKILAKHFAKNN